MYYYELDCIDYIMMLSVFMGFVFIINTILFPIEPRPFGEQLQISEYVTAYKHGNSFEIK